jgi:hypothetical protein
MNNVGSMDMAKIMKMESGIHNNVGIGMTNANGYQYINLLTSDINI